MMGGNANWETRHVTPFVQGRLKDGDLNEFLVMKRREYLTTGL